MKVFIFFYFYLFLYISNTEAENLNDGYGNMVLIEDLLESQNNSIHEMLLRTDSGITVIVNDYADRLFHNLQQLMIRSGLDPVELPAQAFELSSVGAVNLTNGWLQDTSTIARNEDIIVRYSSKTRKLTLNVPIKFNDLMFTYKYMTKVVLIIVAGDVAGKVSNVRANIQLGFDFAKNQAILDNFDITDTGSISLTFSGNNLVDWVTNLMTSVVGTVLHPVIIRVIQYIIKSGLDTAIEEINKTLGMS